MLARVKMAQPIVLLVELRELVVAADRLAAARTQRDRAMSVVSAWRAYEGTVTAAMDGLLAPIRSGLDDLAEEMDRGDAESVRRQAASLAGSWQTCEAAVRTHVEALETTLGLRVVWDEDPRA